MSSSSSPKHHYLGGFLSRKFSKSKSKSSSSEQIGSVEVGNPDSSSRSLSSSDLTSLEKVRVRSQLLKSPCIAPVAVEEVKEKTSSTDALPFITNYFVPEGDQIMSLVVTPPSKSPSPSFVFKLPPSPSSTVTASSAGNGLHGLEKTLQRVKMQLVSIGTYNLFRLPWNKSQKAKTTWITKNMLCVAFMINVPSAML